MRTSTGSHTRDDSHSNNKPPFPSGSPPARRTVTSLGGSGTTAAEQQPLRRSLHKKVPSLSSYQTTPISKHYQLNQQILQAFETNYNNAQQKQQEDQRTLNSNDIPLMNEYHEIAYALGLQFVETAVLEIPKHGYFYSTRHERDRMESSLEAVRVTQILQEIIELQQKQPASKTNNDSSSADLAAIAKLRDLAVAQVEQASEDQYESQRAKAEQELRLHADGRGHQRDPSGEAPSILCEPILVAYDSLTNVFCPPNRSQNVLFGETKQADDETDVDLLSMNTGSSSKGNVSAPACRDDRNIVSSGSSVASARSLGTGTMSISQPRQQRQDPPVISTGIPVENVSADLDNLAEPPPPPPYPKQRNSSASLSVAAAVPPPLIRQQPSEGSPTQRSKRNHKNEQSSSLNSNRSSTSYYMGPDDYFVPIRQRRSTLAASTDSLNELLLEKALYLSGLEVSSMPSMDAGTQDKLRDDNEERVPPPPTLATAIPLAASSSAGGVPGVDSLSLSISNDVGQHQRQYSLDASAGTTTGTLLQLTTVARFYHEDFDQLRQSGLIRVNFVNTYQGKVPESTNGCTVIAPLLCIHHLFADRTVPDPGLPDGIVERVIDDETPAILTQLRSKLGLSSQAFLIPSDSHDYLIQNGQLAQEQFINVTGGNILDEGHLAAFVDALVAADHEKVAATLFFHEHVVAIIKLRRKASVCWYDLIDGLPNKEFLRHVDESDYDFVNRLQLTDQEELYSEAFLPKTARVRCLNAVALTACIKWYACSKFSADNMSYIDQYPWDDKSCDFDPRVFQGFLWGSNN